MSSGQFLVSTNGRKPQRTNCSVLRFEIPRNYIDFNSLMRNLRRGTFWFRWNCVPFHRSNPELLFLTAYNTTTSCSSRSSFTEILRPVISVETNEHPSTSWSLITRESCSLSLLDVFSIWTTSSQSLREVTIIREASKKTARAAPSSCYIHFREANYTNYGPTFRSILLKETWQAVLTREQWKIDAVSTLRVSLPSTASCHRVK